MYMMQNRPKWYTMGPDMLLNMHRNWLSKMEVVKDSAIQCINMWYTVYI